MSLVVGVFLVGWAGCLALQDWCWRRLPNACLLAGVLAGVVHCVVYGATPFGATIANGLVTAALGLLLLLPLYAAGWMGGGDIKLLAVVGWLGGAQVWLVVFVLASVLGGLIAVLMQSSWLRPLFSRASLPARLQGRIPFGAAAAVVVVALIFGWVDVSILPFRLADIGHA